MKRIHLTLVLVTVFFVAAFATAASANTVGTMEINAGYAKSSTELGTSNQSLGGGIGFGASYWRSASPTVSWGGEVSYDNLGSATASGVDPVNGAYTEKFDNKFFRVNPALRVNFGSPVGPSFFAQGGAGLYKMSWNYRYEDGTVGVITAKDNPSKFGYNLGAGVSFPVGPKTHMNVSGAYHIVPGNDVNMKNANNLQIRAGVGFGL